MKKNKDKKIESVSDDSITLNSIEHKKNDNTNTSFERKENINVKKGLTSLEVNDRLSRKLNNINNIKMTKSTWKIISTNLFTFFNVLYAVITVLLCLANSWTNLTFLVIVIPNTILAIWQEIKAKHMVEKLNLVSATKANVVRDGDKQQVDTANVVLDDIIIFSTGNQISADSIIKEGIVEVNESMITGEPDAIVKKPGDMIFSGSYLVSGTCYAQVEHVGKDNYIEQLAMDAKKLKDNKSELLKTLNWIIKIISFIIIPIFLFSMFQAYQATPQTASTFDRFQQSIVNVAGSIIGMIPSGLYLLTTLALSAGVTRLGKKHRTTVQQLYCIEMLARIDILCLDKTGTITDGSMRVIDCIEMKNPTDYNLKQIVGSMMSAFEEKNATSEALIRFFDTNRVLTPENIIPFSSQRKFSAVSFKDVGTFYLGAPEYLFKDPSEKIKSQVNYYATQGCRVIALVYSSSGIKNDTIPNNAKAIALIVIQDHIREDAYETIEYFKNNGVAIRVISGDNPVTVSEIASRVGIENAHKYISLENLTDEEVKEIAFEYTIFGRVSPSQKKALVEAYKAEKKTVAMTGDGVNDILALKEADCSIAMASGSEATKNIANIVLVDSNFSAMPHVVAEGRRVINNIQRTSTLFLVKTIFTILVTLFYMALGSTYPFTPSQLIWTEFFIIGMPAIIISLQPNKEKVTGKFLSNVLKSALPGALTVLLFHMGLYLLGYKIPEFGWFEQQTINGIETLVRTNTFITICLLITMATCITVLYRMCKPFNLLKTIVFVGVLGLTIGMVFLCGTNNWLSDTINNFLKIEWPLGKGDDSVSTLSNILLIILMILLINPVMALIEKIIGRVKEVKI